LFHKRRCFSSDELAQGELVCRMKCAKH
jgi:hypothetical protein